MAKEVIVRISPDGKNISIDQVGFAGASCDSECKNLFDALGDIKSQKKKTEFYSKKKQEVRINNKTSN